MKIGIYFCNCGSNIADKISYTAVVEAAPSFPEQTYVKTVNFICSEEGRQQFEESLRMEQPDRVSRQRSKLGPSGRNPQLFCSFGREWF